MTFNIIFKSRGLNYDSVSPIEHSILKRLSVHNVNLVADVGSYDGEYANACLKYFTTTKIHLFEVNPLFVTRLVSNVVSDRASIHELLLSNKKGSRLFEYDPVDSYTSSLIHGKVTKGGKYDKKIIQETTGDDFFKENQLGPIDILNLNAGNGSTAVVEGLHKHFENELVAIVMLKLNLIDSHTRADLTRTLELLGNYGFMCASFTGGGIDFRNSVNVSRSSDGMQGYLAVHRSRIEVMQTLSK